MREVTERPEGVAAGALKLVGTGSAHIVRKAKRLLDDPSAYAEMAKAANPFGDRHAVSLKRCLRVNRNSKQKHKPILQSQFFSELEGLRSLYRFDCEYNESDESSRKIYYSFSRADNTAGFMGIRRIRKGAVGRGAILP